MIGETTIGKIVDRILSDNAMLTLENTKELTELLNFVVKDTEHLPALLDFFGDMLNEAYDLGLSDYGEYQDAVYTECRLMSFSGEDDNYPVELYSDFETIEDLMVAVVNDRSKDWEGMRVDASTLEPYELADFFNYLKTDDEIVETLTTYVNTYEQVYADR